jgi:spectinomycin phosphotransferase
MRTRPPGLDDHDIQRALADGWGLHDPRLSYLPIGFGSYHWLAESAAGRYFLTLDDLTTKPWLGSEPGTVFAGLRACYGTVLTLAGQAGLTCIVPPVPATDGAPLMRLASRYTLTVFPFAEGAVGPWGAPIGPAERDGLASAFAALHASTGTVAGLAPVRGVELPERAVLEAALGELGRPWSGGPFSEPARKELAPQARRVAAWLESFDRLATRAAARGPVVVVTHGEPHPGNVLWSDGRPRLIDWDTIALAPPERDLWMLDDGSPTVFAAYSAATGCAVDGDALRLYRLTWLLNDLAAFVGSLRSQHRDNGDTRKEWQALRATLAGGPAPDGGLTPSYFGPWQPTATAHLTNHSKR